MFTVRAQIWLAVVMCGALLLSGCGGTHQNHTTTSRSTLRRPQARRLEHSDVILSLSGLGSFIGRCPRGAHQWTVRFVVAPEGLATDTVAYRIGSGPRRITNVYPGTLAFRLTPGAARVREPADRFVPPEGQGRGAAAATSVATTTPLDVLIYQGSEPQTLRADVHLALATIGGESGQCVLAASTVRSNWYPNAPQ